MNRKQMLVGGVAVLGVFGAGFGLARYTTPERVEVKTLEKTTYVEVEKKTETEVKHEERAAQVQTQQRVRREERTVARPDGTVETTRTETIDTDHAEKEQVAQVVRREATEERAVQVQQERQHSSVVEMAKPKWRAGALVGVDLGRALKADLGGSLVYGGELERRLFGPVHGGVWALSNGTGGVKLSVEF